MRKLLNTVILAFGSGFLLIGAYLSIVGEWRENYFIFMFALGLIAWYLLRALKDREKS
jgi:hypothetical protein